MIHSLDQIIPFSRRHPNETVRQILQYDSGYVKDLFLKDSRLVFSEDCFNEICQITDGHKDEWVKPENCASFLDGLKRYAVPYLYDFNNETLRSINQERLTAIRGD